MICFKQAGPRFVRALCVWALLTQSSVAFAQDAPSSGNAPRAPDTYGATAPRSRPGVPRARWSVGGVVSGIFVSHGVDGGGGVYGRLGYQPSDLFGIEVELDTTTAIISSLFRSDVAVSVTPVDWLSFAVGPTLAWGYEPFDFGSWFVAGTARVDLNLLSARTPGGARHALTIGVAGDVAYGLDYNSDPLGFGLSVHRNPVEAGVVTRPRDSTWTSHRIYLRLEPAPPWFDVEWPSPCSASPTHAEGAAVSTSS